MSHHDQNSTTDAPSADSQSERPTQPESESASRRMFVRTALGVAAGAVGAVALSSAEPAAAATGIMQYGAIQNSGQFNERFPYLKTPRAGNAD